MKQEYRVDPRLLGRIKKNMQGCPQIPSDLMKIKKLDSDKVNRSQSTEGYRTPRWLIEERGNFTLLGELPNLEYLRIARVELGDWSFLAQCKKLRSLILPDTDFTDCRLLLELPLLEKVALPPKRKLQHREVLDTLKAKSCSPAVQEEQPFYRDEDYEDMAVVKGEDIHPDYQGSHEVRCVSASFHGKQPPHWRDFPHQEYQEDNWKNLSPEEREILAQELAQAVQKEKVQDFILSLEPWGEGHFLCGEFAPGWAALWYDSTDSPTGSYSCYNPDYDTVEDLCPIEVGGQSPVPKMWALEDMEEAARIVRHFLLTGELAPGSLWLHEGGEE